MPFKSIAATEARVGTNIIVDGISCVIRSMDVSKTGKHGHAKVRIEAVGIINGQKKVFVVPGHDKLEVPLVEKKKAQILSISGENANVMDVESFENFDMIIDEEMRGQLQDGDSVEYWIVEGEKVVKRKV
jgi:translation initiation factor 5A